MLYTVQKITTVTIKPTKKSETNRFHVTFTTFSSFFFWRCLESKIRAVIADRPIFRKRFECFLEKKKLGGKEKKTKGKERRRFVGMQLYFSSLYLVDKTRHFLNLCPQVKKSTY